MNHSTLNINELGDIILELWTSTLLILRNILGRLIYFASHSPIRFSSINNVF
jgi:hypothetical protein